MENKKLKVYLKDGSVHEAILFYQPFPNPSVQLQFNDFDSGIINGQYIYQSMQSLHAILDNLKIKLMCNCYRYDVRPSQMSIDMGGGGMANKLIPGIRPNTTVSIFEPTEDVGAIVSVEDQQKYFTEWLKSLN